MHIFILTFLKLLDIGLTYFALEEFGISAEFNPIVREMLSQYSIEFGLFVNFIIYMMLSTVLVIKKEKKLILIVELIMILVVGVNILNLFFRS
jgi:hypothetical protein